MRGVLFAGAVLAAAGCSRGGKTEDFTPPADTARTALEAALNHWQAGNPHGTVPGTRPAVEVLDGKWRDGQKLKEFEVVKEDTPGPGPRYFVVKLTPEKGPPQDVRYVVVGIDPVWVYREDDFKKLSGTGM